MPAPSLPASPRRYSGKADRSGGSGAFHEKRQREAFGFSHMQKIPQRQVAAAEFLLYGGKRRDSGEGMGNG